MLAATLPDSITFAVCAAIILVSAIGVVISRNPVHSALYLVATLFGVAVLFVEQDAEFLAAVQVIVYAGAIVVLFLFVIMLLGVDRPERLAADPLKGQRPLAVVLGLVALGEVVALARLNWATGAHHVVGPPGGPSTNVADLARAIFTTYLLPFEVTSALLVIAVIGAVVLSRRQMRRPTSPGPEPGNQANPRSGGPEEERSEGPPERLDAPDERYGELRSEEEVRR